ncbi:MAG: M3 family metallopeptidase [Betaproteobacteria bacterium]|nr:M3 family metallopeptidase [Betaproteobacteria bacterium]
MNPLLDFSGLPRFNAVRAEHVQPAVEQLIIEGRAAVEAAVVETTPPTWDNFVRPLDDAGERLSRAWGQVSHLNAVMNSPELRDAYNAMLPVLTQYYTELGQDERLYAKYKALRASSEYSQLSDAQKKTLENELRDFRLSGAELPEAEKARFKALQEELSTLSSRFNDNVLDATNDFALYVADAHHLAGLPDDVKQVAKEAAEKDGKPGWKLTLHMPCYLPVMQYADHRPLREQLYRAYVTRASDQSLADKAKDWDNTANIRNLLKLRQESAELLGFANFAELSLATKMARTPAEVVGFLRELGAKAKPYAERDMRELTDYARRELGMPDVQAWDIPYVSEKLRVAKYAFSDQEVKQYFPEPVVLDGMFRVVKSIFGIEVRPATAETWHADVRFFDVLNEAGERIGQFFLDLYARDKKRGGAWMDDVMARRRVGNAVQIPVAYLTCNFSAPVGGKPALFTHDEVITLFHEFGHGLHHLLTQVDELAVSGISGVEWDAVELPSQFMENFCWEWEVLKHMTKHVDSGESLPRALFDKMLAAKNFQNGMGFVRQLEFALFDMRLHADFDVLNGDMLALLADVRREVAVIKPPEWNRFPHQFGHIFGGGYAAGYYSYKWAEVLSADAYAAFEEHPGGVLNREVGRKFQMEVLAAGGARPAMASFKAFRGREPSTAALIRHNGMDEPLAMAA